MFRRAFIALGASLAALPFASRVARAAPRPVLNKWALVCGVNGTAEQPVDGDGSARLMASALKSVYGFSNIKLLTNREANQAGILSGLAWLRANADANSSVYVFYSGHGSQGWAGLMYDQWATELSTIPHERMGVVFEACYAGNGPGIVGPALTNAVVIGSTLPGEVGVSRSRLSAFAEDFIDEGMRQGLADQPYSWNGTPVGNGDGLVSLQEAARYTDTRTFDTTTYDGYPELVP
jgi:hypothetical protein